MDIGLGRHPGLAWADYRATGALGTTAIRAAAEPGGSVAHALAKKTTDAMRKGSLDHLVLLEPSELERRYVVAQTGPCDGVVQGRPCKNRSLAGASSCASHGGRAGADAFEAAAAAAGREVVESTWLDAAQDRAAAVRANLQRTRWPHLLDDGESEVSYLVRAALAPSTPGMLPTYRMIATEAAAPRMSSLLCVRVDREHGGGLWDAKAASRGVGEDAWRRKLEAEHLYCQAAQIVDAVAACIGEELPFRWLAYETEPPYAVRIYRASGAHLALGRMMVAEGLRRWEAYGSSGDKWAGYPRGEGQTELSPWTEESVMRHIEGEPVDGADAQEAA